MGKSSGVLTEQPNMQKKRLVIAEVIKQVIRNNLQEWPESQLQGKQGTHPHREPDKKNKTSFCNKRKNKKLSIYIY